MPKIVDIYLNSFFDVLNKWCMFLFQDNSSWPFQNSYSPCSLREYLNLGMRFVKEVMYMVANGPRYSWTACDQLVIGSIALSSTRKWAKLKQFPSSWMASGHRMLPEFNRTSAHSSYKSRLIVCLLYHKSQDGAPGTWLGFWLFLHPYICDSFDTLICSNHNIILASDTR